MSTPRKGKQFFGDPPPVPGQPYKPITAQEAEAQGQITGTLKQLATEANPVAYQPVAAPQPAVFTRPDGVTIGRAAPFMHRRPTMPLESRMIEEPLTPGVLYPVTLRASDTVKTHAASSLYQEMCAKYLGTDDAKAAADFPSMEPLDLSTQLFLTAATICVMQDDPEDEGFPILPPYTFEELVMLAHTHPNLWESMVEMAGELNNQGQKLLKNGSRAVGASTSEPPSAT